MCVNSYKYEYKSEKFNYQSGNSAIVKTGMCLVFVQWNIIAMKYYTSYFFIQSVKNTDVSVKTSTLIMLPA